jgi:hypothetical protein
VSRTAEITSEFTCEGSREVGVFWSKALGWPLVWNQNEETAIQSPQGGTKLAWAGPPVPPKSEPNRQRFELTAATLDELISLGATRLENGALADPDGNEFHLR